MPRVPDENCVDRLLGEALTSYCFGGLSDDERSAVEEHLLECEACWTEFQRLDASVRALRVDATLRPTLAVSDVVSLLGLSSRLGRPFGGHLGYVLWIVGLYSLEWVVGVWSELAYAYDRLGRLALSLSIPTAIAVAAALALALWSDTRAIRAGRTNGLLRSTGTALMGLAALVAVLMFMLPTESIILASFQTRTVAGGFFKDALQIFLPLLLFVIPSFHTILQLQRDLAVGRHRLVAKLLTRQPDRVWPRGVLYVAPQALAALLLVLGILKILGMNHMLDALRPGPYANLFIVASYVSTGLWFAIGLGSLGWFHLSLNELRRESQAMALLDHHRVGGVTQ